MNQGVRKNRSPSSARVWTDLVEVTTEDYPHVRPFDTDAVHVVIADVDQFLETEKPWMVRHPRRFDFLP